MKSMNIKKTINKLQKALMQKGIIYKINTYQFFSTEQGRMITGYSIREKQPVAKPNGNIVMKDMELFNTCSRLELLKWFVEEWKKVK